MSRAGGAGAEARSATTATPGKCTPDVNPALWARHSLRSCPWRAAASTPAAPLCRNFIVVEETAMQPGECCQATGMPAHLKCTVVCTLLFSSGLGRKAYGSAVRHASASSLSFSAALALAAGGAAPFPAAAALGFFFLSGLTRSASVFGPSRAATCTARSAGTHAGWAPGQDPRMHAYA